MSDTADAMVERALGRASEVTQTYPSARGPMYVRLGMRQRALFARAAKKNPERYGTCATSPLQTVNGIRAVDLNDIAAPTPTPEMIQAVTIDDKGTSPYAAGDVITIVGIEDMNAELPPRALLRDRVLIGVGGDLDLVTSVKIHYPRLSDLFLATDAAKVLELEPPFDTLLEVDLAKWLILKATQIAAEVRAGAVASFEAEEALLLAEYDEHVLEYTPTVSRFTAPRVLAREN